MMNTFLENAEEKRDFAYNLASILNGAMPIIVCIGSDRVVSDMIGPMTAEILVKKYDIDAYVYGRLDNPIVAKNLKSAFRYIRNRHADGMVVVIDATLGKLSDVGMVKLRRGGCIPAGGFSYNYDIYGDVSILPVVSTIGIQDKEFLIATKFNTIYKLAENIAECVNNAINISKGLSSMAI